MTSPLHAAIAAANADGYLVNNLFQISDGEMWQANLRCKDKPEHGVFAMGYTPDAALEAALERMWRDFPPAPKVAVTGGIFD